MTRVQVQSDRLSIAVDVIGAADGEPVILQHGWPDSPESFLGVAERLAGAGYRCFLPTLRGHGDTRFLSADTMRSGQVVALARDIEAVIDGFDLTRLHLVGHDWGARASYAAAILFPKKLASIVAISLGWRPTSRPSELSVEQVQAFWYQWWFATPMGEAALRDRPDDVARRMWETWSPEGWFDETDWASVPNTLSNPDWASVVTHYYRARYGLAPLDESYARDEQTFAAAEKLATPVCVIHGGADTCTLPALSEGMEPFVAGPFQRHTLDGIGHFPQREAPSQIAELLHHWMDACAGSVPSP